MRHVSTLYNIVKGYIEYRIIQDNFILINFIQFWLMFFLFTYKYFDLYWSVV